MIICTIRYDSNKAVHLLLMPDIKLRVRRVNLSFILYLFIIQITGLARILDYCMRIKNPDAPCLPITSVPQSASLPGPVKFIWGHLVCASLFTKHLCRNQPLMDYFSVCSRSIVFRKLGEHPDHYCRIPAGISMDIIIIFTEQISVEGLFTKVW